MKGNALPYVTSEIRSLIKTRDYLKSKAIKTGSNYIQQAFCQVRSKVFSLLKKSRQDYYTRRIEEYIGDMKKTWKILKQAIKAEEQSSVIEKISYSGEEISGNQKVAETCNSHFAEIGKKLADEIPQSSCSVVLDIKKPNIKFKFREVTLPEVTSLLKKLLNGKATGIDGITNRALKDSAELIAPSLTDFFNFSIVQKPILMTLK